MVRLRFNLFALHKIKTEQFVVSYKVLHFARNFLCCTHLRRLTSSRNFAVTEMKRFSEGLRNNKTLALSLFNISCFLFFLLRVASAGKSKTVTTWSPALVAACPGSNSVS